MRKKLTQLGLLILVGTFAAGCEQGSDDSSSSSSSLTIEGSLGGASAQSISYKSASVGAFTMTDYKVRCVTLTGSPQAGEGAVGSDGSFSLDISVSGSDAVPVGCFILAVADDSVAATVTFDTGSTGMGASSLKEGSLPGAAGNAMNFGAINFDPDTGVATVDKSSISYGRGAAPDVSGTWTDPTGSWNMTCTGLTTGYDCPVESGTFPIFIHQFSATNNTTSQTEYGLSIWMDDSGSQTPLAAFQGCDSSGSEGTENIDALIGSTHSSPTTSISGADVTDDFAFSSWPNLAALDTVTAPMWSGQSVCGATVAGDDGDSDGILQCDEITNRDSWGDGSITFSDNDCKALCAIQSLENENDGYGSCARRVNVAWNKIWDGGTLSSPGDLYADYDTIDGTTTASSTAGIVNGEDEPSHRKVIGQLTTNGKIGSVVSEKEYTWYICVGDGTSACSSHKCTATETVKMNITAESAASIVAEVVIAMVPDNDRQNQTALVLQRLRSRNWFIEESLVREKFLLTGTK
ncbi:MAG: hypothetical protein R2827_02880 [Bdellovibrionales bacterium]